MCNKKKGENILSIHTWLNNNIENKANNVCVVCMYFEVCRGPEKYFINLLRHRMNKNLNIFWFVTQIKYRLIIFCNLNKSRMLYFYKIMLVHPYFGYSLKMVFLLSNLLT